MVKRGVGSIKIFRQKFFVSECRKLSSSNLSVLQKFFCLEKCQGKEGAGIKIFVKLVLSHSAENFRRETLLCFRKLRVSKIFIPKLVISRFSIEILLSQSTEELRRGTLLFLTSFLVLKNFWIRGAGDGGREFHLFPSIFFVSQCQKFRRGILQCFITFGYRKMLGIRVGGTHDFPPNLFCLRVPRHLFVEESFCAVFKNISGSEKVYG